ncbi:MAG: sigma-70 family RNA polymerase sigma factor [Planctomycetota bacterium]
MDRLASLFQRYRTRHDVAALGHVFDRAAPDLIRVALHLTRCPSLAEDAVQSTFLVAIERAETFDAGRPLMPWLVGILRNVVRQQRRKGQRLAHGEGPESVTEPTSVLDRALDELVWTDRIAEVVETFPPAWRQAFVLRYRHGLAPAEIADVTATAPATVRSHLHRGLLRLQRTLPTTCEQRPAVVLLPLLGLDGLRRAVLTRAAAGATAAPALATPVIPGALMVKKLAPWLLVLLVPALFATGLIQLPSHAPDDADPATSLESGTASSRAPTLEAAPTAVALGDAPGAADIDLPATAGLENVDRDRDVHGIVVDAAGQPVAGAELKLVRYPWGGVDLWTGGFKSRSVEGPSGRSARDGTFRLPWNRDQVGRLRVRATGYAPLYVDDTGAGERLRIVLAAAATLRVTVRGPDEELLEGIEVHASYRDRATGQRVRSTATTDAEGAAELADLPQGLTVKLGATLEGTPWHLDDAMSVDLPLAPSHAARLDLTRAAVLTGRVLDDATGRPIEGASICVGCGHVTSKVRADEGGAFTLPLVDRASSSRNDIEAWAPGYARTMQMASVGSPVELRLVRGCVLRGQVVDRTGKPVGGARVAAVGTDFHGETQHLSFAAVESGDDGRFALEDLDLRLPHTISVAAAGHGRCLFDIDACAPLPERDVGTLPLGRACIVRGTLTTPDGTPVPNADVTCEGANDDRVRLRAETDEPAQMSYGRTVERKTDDLGRFSFPDLAPGTYQVQALPWTSRAVRRQVRVDADAPVLDVELQVVDVRTVRVQVVDDEGTPLPEFHVSVYGGGMADHMFHGTDAHGVARIDLPRGQAVRLIASVPRGRPYLSGSMLQVAADATEATLVMQRALLTKGTVLDPDGQPLRGAIVRVAEEGESRVLNAHAEDDGTFTIAQRAGAISDFRFEGRIVRMGVGTPEDYTLPLSGEATGISAGDTNVVIRTHRDETYRSVTVVVTEPDGTPAEFIYVLTEGVKGNETKTDGRGRAEVHRLPDADVVLRFSSPLFKPPPFLMPEPLTVRPAGQTVNVRLRPANVLEGTVIGPADESGLGWQVEAKVAGEVVAEGRTDLDGTFRLLFPTTTTIVDEVTATATIGDQPCATSAYRVEVPRRDLGLKLEPR